MEPKYSLQALKDLKGFEKNLQEFFISHIEKLQNMPPRRHLKHGLPWDVEDITKQARLVYDEKENTLYIVRCFATHKEYERWYQSFK